MADHLNTVPELEAKLADIIVNWPLYRTFYYTGKGCHQTWTGGARFGKLPARLTMYCPNDSCKQETWWDVDDAAITFASAWINHCTYTCRNCGKSQVDYYFIWKERESQNIFIKVGQYPELQERVSEALAKALDPEDLKLYKNAIRMRNFNLGIAAVAYMRRVIENKLGDMLDILHEAAVAHNASPELLARHKEMKNEKRFSTKVEYAGDLLPANLRPPGKPNPMAILHELVSEGLHSKSDAECVDIFDKCRATFEYVFAKLRIEIEDAKNFVTAMSDLAQVKAKAAEAKPVTPKTPPS